MGGYQKPSGFWRSLNLAARGITYSWKTQGHLKFHTFAAIIVILIAGWLKITRWEWVFLVLSIGSVITAEIMNTAIELVVDLVEPHFHPIAGMAKDVAAGAVLVTAIQAVIVGVFIFLPFLLQGVRNLVR